MDIAKIRKKLKESKPGTLKKDIKPEIKEEEKVSSMEKEITVERISESTSLKEETTYSFPGVQNKEESSKETEKKLLISQEQSPSEAQEIEMVVFTLGKEEYAFRLETLLEILRRQFITNVPCAIPFLVGITSLRGKVIPVIDLSMRLTGKKVSDSLKNRILVMEGKKGIVGCLVDEINGVVRTSLMKKEEPPEHIREEERVLIDGVFIIDSRFITLLRDKAFEFK